MIELHLNRNNRFILLISYRLLSMHYCATFLKKRSTYDGIFGIKVAIMFKIYHQIELVF
jgi:hypothetical protein